MRRKILLVLVMLLITLAGANAVECGSIPTTGCNISMDTTFATGTYSVTNITVVSSDITINLNNSILNASGLENIILFYVNDVNNVTV